MSIQFSSIRNGSDYSRQYLAQLWNYSSFNAIARGVVTPRGDNKIVLFVTKNKQESAEQYRNDLIGSKLSWEGPTDHFAEQRMMNAGPGGDQIHVFYRERHHMDFTYLGEARVSNSTLRTDAPSSFTFDL